MAVPVSVGSVVAERYRVDGILGSGGMGVVVMATHLVLKQRVAIKFLRPEVLADANAVSRFVREAQAAATVQNEHVVRVQDVAALPDGTPYIVMEYVEGMVLSTLIASQGRLPVGEAVRYAVQTCEALAATHAAGIVHGDLKPENIYIAGTGGGPRRVKLLDFGISKIALEDAGGARPSDVVMGTPAYMAPEQFEAGSVQARSDIWALGAVLYEMLAGAPPFLGETPDEIRVGVMSEPIAPIGRPDMPPGLEDVIQLCLHKNPEERWGSAAELAAALEEYAPAGSAPQRHVSLPPAANVRTSQKFVPTVVLSNRQKTGYGTWAFAAIGMAIVALVLMLVGATHHFRNAPLPIDLQPAAVAAAPAAVPDEPASTASASPAPPPAEPVMAIATAAPSTSIAADPPKRTPGRRPKPRNGARTPGTADAPQTPPDDGDRFGTRK